MSRSGSIQPSLYSAQDNPEGLEYLRSTWQFAAISQFLRTFQSALDLNDFETEDLEDALLSPQPVHFLVNILVRLLRAITGLRFISPDNWQQYWNRTFHDELWQQYNSLVTQINSELPAFVNCEDFWQLMLADKVHGIHALCEMALLEADKFLPNVRDEEEQHLWRVDPVGFDAQNNTFWLFDDNRLYMETPLPEDRPKPPKQAAAKGRGGRKPPARRRFADSESAEATAAEDNSGGQRWSLVCRTLDDWREFPARFQGSTNAAEKAFYRFLTDDLQPQVVEALEEKDRELELQRAMANRKRSDRLVVREIERMELEEQERRRRQEQERQAQSRREALGNRRSEQEQKRAEKEREERFKEREERIRKREELKHKKDLLAAKMESRRLAKEQQHQPQAETCDGPNNRRQQSWTFDCPCGVYGQNIDDGRPMMECEQCNTWVHIPCINRRFAKNGIQTPDWDQIPYMCEFCASGETRPPLANRPPSKLPTVIKRNKKRTTADDGTEEGPGTDGQKQRKLPKIKLIVSPRAEHGLETASIPAILPKQPSAQGTHSSGGEGSAAASSAVSPSSQFHPHQITAPLPMMFTQRSGGTSLPPLLQPLTNNTSSAAQRMPTQHFMHPLPLQMPHQRPPVMPLPNHPQLFPSAPGNYNYAAASVPHIMAGPRPILSPPLLSPPLPPPPQQQQLFYNMQQLPQTQRGYSQSQPGQSYGVVVGANHTTTSRQQTPLVSPMDSTVSQLKTVNGVASCPPTLYQSANQLPHMLPHSLISPNGLPVAGASDISDASRLISPQQQSTPPQQQQPQHQQQQQRNPSNNNNGHSHF